MPTAVRTAAFSRRIGLALVLAAGLAGTSACQKEKQIVIPELRGSEAVDRDAWRTLGYNLSWSGFGAYNLAREARTDLVATFPDMVVLVDTSGTATALSPSNGSIKWSAVVDSGLTKFVGVSRYGRDVVFVADDQAIIVEGESGRMMARQRFARLSAGQPVQINQMLVFGGASGVAVGHMLDSGVDAWTYQLGAPIRVNPVWLGNTNVGFVTGAGTCVVIDAGSGSARGSHQMYLGALASPVAAGETWFVPSLDQSLYALSARDASLKWQLRTDRPLIHPPAVHGGVVYMQWPGRGLAAINADNGKPIWVAQGVTGDVVTVRQGRPIVWDGKTATVLNAGSGEVEQTVVLPNLHTLKATSIVDGDLYAVSPVGEVSRFTPR